MPEARATLAGRHDPDCVDGRAGLLQDQRPKVADQKGWLVLSSKGARLVVTGGHDVPENEPKLVTAEILRVVTAARGR